MPRATSELRRGLNAHNLRVGALSATALGVVMLAATVTGTVPDVLGLGAVAQALGTALALFVTITGIHTAAHTYFGWRFDRGLGAVLITPRPRTACTSPTWRLTGATFRCLK